MLVSQLRPEEAAAVAQELDKEGVTYEVADKGTTLLVPADQRDTVQLRVAGADLLIKGQEGFELFDTSELGLTEFAQRIKYQRALQGELARTIMKIDGVIDARIHISIPEKSVFKSERSPAKAAVTLLTRSPAVETAEAIAGVQQLVAAAIPDLDPRDVVVLNKLGVIISAPINETIAGPDLARLEATIRTIVPEGSASVTAEMTPPTPGVDQQAAASSSGSNIPTYSLRVTTAAPLAPADQERVRGIVLSDSRSGPQSITNVEFGVLEPAASQLLQPPASAPSPQLAFQKPESLILSTQPHRGEGMRIPLLEIGVGLAALLVVLLILFLGLSRRRRPLSLRDQRKFAEQLRIGLEARSQEVADGAI